MMEMFSILIEGGMEYDTQVDELVRTQQTGHVTCVPFTVYTFYLNTQKPLWSFMFLHCYKWYFKKYYFFNICYSYVARQ